MTNIKILNDPRHLTTYKTQSQIDRDILDKSNIKTNYDYRMFLTKNGSSIIDTNRVIVYNNTQYSDVNQNINKSPYIFNNIDNSLAPSLDKMSDLKHKYLSRESLNNKLQF